MSGLSHYRVEIRYNNIFVISRKQRKHIYTRKGIKKRKKIFICGMAKACSRRENYFISGE